MFLSKVFHDPPHLKTLMVQLSNTEFLKIMIYSRPTVVLVAKFAYDVLEISTLFRCGVHEFVSGSSFLLIASLFIL
jgi:hypothetical protein